MIFELDSLHSASVGGVLGQATLGLSSSSKLIGFSFRSYVWLTMVALRSLFRSSVFRRILFGALFLFLIGFLAVTFCNFVRSPTDENLFANPVSPVMASKAFQATRVHYLRGKEEGGARSEREDSINVGDFLYSVNRQRIVVVEVTPGGASDRAGMSLGDFIVRINGEEFSTPAEADAAMRRAQTGRTVVYEILRGDRRIDLYVTLARFGVPIGNLVLFLSGLFMLGVGLFIVLKRPHITAATLTGLSFVLLGFTIAILWIRRDIGPSFLTELRNVLAGVCGFFGIAVATHARAYFPKEWPALLRRRWPIVVPYALAAASVILTTVLGNVAFICAALMIAFSFSVVFALRKERTPEQRALESPLNKLQLLGAGLLFFCTLPFANLFRGVPLGIIGVLLAAVPVGYLLSIGRHHLLDLDLRVRRNTQYTIVIGDVSGKGTSAALYMSKVQGILESLHSFGLSVCLAFPAVVSYHFVLSSRLFSVVLLPEYPSCFGRKTVCPLSFSAPCASPAENPAGLRGG